MCVATYLYMHTCTHVYVYEHACVVLVPKVELRLVRCLFELDPLYVCKRYQEGC